MQKNSKNNKTDKKAAWKENLQKAGHGLLRLLFPLHCPVCDGIVADFEEKICPGCVKRLKLLTPPRCLKCGKKLYHDGERCSDCTKRQHAFRRGRALYEYGSVATPVYRFKYGGRQEYADFFGEEAAEYLGDFIREIGPDGLVPIPLHKKRMRKRGYNQAELFAKALGKYTGIPVYSDLLVRVKNTVPLKMQNPSERQNNLKKAFIIARNDVKLDKIIIVDDIYTTGSTMDEAAGVLRRHGAGEIYFITLACGAGI